MLGWGGEGIVQQGMGLNALETREEKNENKYWVWEAVGGKCPLFRLQIGCIKFSPVKSC